MNKSCRLFLMFVIVYVLLFKYDNVQALTCEYEMYPVNYTTNGINGLTPVESGITTTAKLKYTTDSNDSYTLQHITTLGNSSSHTFTHKSFNNDVWKDKTSETVSCPYYIYVKDANKSGVGGEVNVLSDLGEFLEKQNSFMNSAARTTKYPMVLVKENGKVKASTIVASMNEALKNWSTIISNANTYLSSNGCDSSTVNAKKYNMTLGNFNNYVSGDYSSRKTIDKNMSEACWNARKNYVNLAILANQYKNSLNSSSSANMNISKATNYDVFEEFILKTSGAYDDTKAKEEVEEKLNTIKNDYCSLYCETMVCKQTNATAQSACLSSCNSSIKPKCDSSYNSCSNIQSTDSKENCLINNFSANGLDYSTYSQIRIERVDALEKEIKRYETAIASSLNIEFNPYKLQCSDVSMLHIIWKILIIGAPILTILMGILDFSSAVIASDEEKIKKAWKKFPKRLLACVITILLPILVSIIVGISNDENVQDKSIMYCIINGGE